MKKPSSMMECYENSWFLFYIPFEAKCDSIARKLTLLYCTKYRYIL